MHVTSLHVLQLCVFVVTRVFSIEMTTVHRFQSYLTLKRSDITCILKVGSSLSIEP